MQAFYNLLIGPGAWIAFAVFLGGCAWRLSTMGALARRKDMVAVAYMESKHSLNSIMHWVTPFATLGWRENPAMTVATFAFHISIVLLALFAPGHATMWDYAFGVGVWALPEAVADILTIVALAACGFFAWRRLSDPTVSFVTRPMDWLVLGLAAVPLLTGILAKYVMTQNLVFATLHVLSGEAMLVALPFTRLSHAVFSVFTRAYIGSEFGAVRHCKDW
ncbi:TmcC family electron transfer complex membrane anchor subunit [Nitratidesulfovibrio vulgaris]|uniref:Membrane protein, putative n=1 Tax=Nitratidesulfovibrio vulgaris (strain ATCC 29579 / DSM 644 / CCUG 34227 / NCIMB 8303 / VKM B-1760 / Hildenborough) TaxID=882 RepID=Q72FE9_NITV2|nr:hypothetical protein [Nitratidesulfovibrio vulgaris]AAS94748.1 membrane protein, putative [Nitratidesulfovibrio vulgaris str. Hildenborough]ADP85408.1 hypothetical protein Deval_0237 [Nitratidesulfovibrio vulgaris RCH1]